MTNANFNDDEDKPLDPVMEKVRRKMIRLQLVSASTIVLSLMAVLGAVVYKARLSGAENTVAASDLLIPANGALALNAIIPVGFTLQSASLHGNRVLLTGTGANGGSVLHVFDMAAGRVVATILLKPE